MLLDLIRRQRECFIRTIDGEKIITNHILYDSLEEEIYKEQIKIGKENKRAIITECLLKGKPLPNFSREGISKK